MGISRRAQTGDLGANLKRMFARIRQREIQDFLRPSITIIAILPAFLIHAYEHF